MPGATRSAHRKPPARNAQAASLEHSSGTTVADHDMHAGHIGYATPLHTEFAASTEGSRLSQDCEPPSKRNGTHARSSSAGTVTSEAAGLGEHVKEAISAISRLEGLGLQRLQIPLPKCVVLGEQSAGKSSVIEAISGIKTPRSTECCTRCPLFIKMEPSDPPAKWHAKVFLRKSYDYLGVEGKTRGKSTGKFPGWSLKDDPTELEFASTSSPSGLEGLIERAQMATLSPLNDPMEFLEPGVLSRDPDSYHQCRFSPNVVCIHVSQPDMPALSFYDLPGIIGQSETASDQFLVKFVKDLVTEYVRDLDALVLVTCSLANDIATSTAAGIARELKATNRCIGVLTKPDCLPPGSRDDKLRAVLDGTRFALGHGYFVVKNPDQTSIERGLAHRDARVLEQQFFAQYEPWATTFDDYQSRFGTPNLQGFLSKKLAAQVFKKLPTIHDQINARLQKVEKDLSLLPEPPTHNATRIISDIVFRFSDDMRKQMEAEHMHTGWRTRWDLIRQTFLDGLLSMKPTMSVLGRLDKDIFSSTIASNSADDAIVIDIDDDDADGDIHMTESSTPQKKRKLGESATPVSIKTQDGRSETPFTTLSAKPIPPTQGFSHLRKVFRLDEFAEHLQATSKSKMPGQLQPRITEDMSVETIKNWHMPLQVFFKAVENQLREQVRDLFETSFMKWRGSALYTDAWSLVEDLLNSNLVEQRATMAMESLNDELEGPYHFHADIYSHEKAAIRETYRQHRYNARLKVYSKEMRLQTGRTLTLADHEKLKKDEKKLAVIKAEPYDKEIDVIASVTCNYLIAARRFHDSICMRIESKFFKCLRTRLREVLESGLGIYDDQDGPRNAKELLAEPPERQHHRKQLVAMKNALLQGQKCLADMEKNCDDAPSQVLNGVPVNGSNFSSFGPTSTPLTEEMVDITRSGRARR